MSTNNNTEELSTTYSNEQIQHGFRVFLFPECGFLLKLQIKKDYMRNFTKVPVHSIEFKQLIPIRE